jgi:uncharacterized protein (DUF427 family)
MALIPDLERRRGAWRWRGQERPPFADLPRAGQESVWDYPRPPRVVDDSREIVIRWGTVEIARSQRALRILETGHPPSFYLPWDDVARQHLQPGSGTSICEWKGPARYWSLVHGGSRLTNVAWSYPAPWPGAAAIAECVAFYPASLQCTVGGAVVTPQPGGFYGGWITPELAGPFKGAAGTTGW